MIMEKFHQTKLQWMGKLIGNSSYERVIRGEMLVEGQERDS